MKLTAAIADESNARESTPEVTKAYQTAHKNYVLVAALLGSWQLLGITVETKDKWGITLKSPSAVPLILFALVVYFGYKVTIEWLQCDERRRKNPAALLDFRIAHIIAVVSISISLVQYVLQRQLLDVLARLIPTAERHLMLAGMMIGAGLSKLVPMLWNWPKNESHSSRVWFAVAMTVSASMIIAVPLSFLYPERAEIFSLWSEKVSRFAILSTVSIGLGIVLERLLPRIVIDSQPRQENT
jgi:uncharacterized membrane protein